MTLFDLTGRVALVTGGNGGIGLGMARGLAAAGARVLVVGRDAGKNAAALAALAALGDGHAAFVADVTAEAECRAAVAEAEARFGRLDVLVNNAGGNRRIRPETVELADWSAVLDMNLTSAYLMSRAAYPLLRQGGGGKVVNIGSLLSLFGTAASPAYAAAKGGIVQFTKVLATAWAADGIQANAILPGWVDTALTEGARAQDPALHERVLARTPAGRWGAADDFAGIAVFLASPASDWVTGTAIPVDGGFAAQG